MGQIPSLCRDVNQPDTAFISNEFAESLGDLNHVGQLCGLHSLSMGEKKTSEEGLARLHLYKGIGFPLLDLQLRVTFPFSTGFPDKVHLGTDGGTERRRGGIIKFFLD